MQRAVAVILALVCAAHAGPVQMWSIEELANAPQVAVARIEKITLGPEVGVEKLPWRTPTRTCTAELKVLRAWPNRGASSAALDYFCYGASVTQLMSGSAIFPDLRAGGTYVLPLKRAANRWRLIHDSGMGLVVPAIAAPLGHEPYGSARDALIREIVNSLVQGDYIEINRLGLYLGVLHGKELGTEIAQHLDEKLPPSDRRWLDIATALMGSMGIPRGSLDSLISNQPALGVSANIASHALRQVPEPARRAGVVRNMLTYSAVHPWGTAATLVPEFKDDPLLLESLPVYLERGHAGALTVASWLVNNGQPALLPLSVTVALQVIRDGRNASDLQAACDLVSRHGSDSDFDEYVTALVKAKTTDLRLYNQLWQVAYGLEAPRNFRLIEVWLADERIMSGRMRYCDIAGGVLQKAAKEDFGFTVWDAPLAARQAALRKARAWMTRNRK